MSTIAIIGAGAAGMMAAITAKQTNPNLHITIFEKNDKIGKKILASGNGRCNIANSTFSKENYFGYDTSFVNYALKQFDFKKIQNFFLNLGLLLDVKEDGKVYPLSNEAKAVVFVLENEAKRLGINFVFNCTVENIAQKDAKFMVQDKIFDKVLVTTGLGAAPQLGATQGGLDIAKKFGHTVFPTYPSLVGLEIESSIPSRLFGVKLLSMITLYVNDKQEEQQLGDLLFTKYGVSGFGILDISTAASFALQQHSKVSIALNLLPTFDRKQLLNLLSAMQKKQPKKTIEKLLQGVLPQKLIPVVIGNTIKETVNNIQNMRFEIAQTHGFKHAEVSGGGVSTSELNDQTMQSKHVDGLYFAGEVVDIVGHRGGYNFSFAWASAYLCGRSLAQAN
ncbi:MAG: aminoacetone oxidase family FAD-binding enzyme [Campylobacterota bacterium]|nr:aminoacetone oxidase family FAD-binding enzyme [Campylobacterota bacterium]